MAYASRFLCHSRKLCAGQKLFQMEPAVPVRYFSNEAPPRPVLKGDEMLKNIFYEVKNKFETAIGVLRKEKITIDPDDPAAVAHYAKDMKTVREKMEECEEFFSKDGIFLVVMGTFQESSFVLRCENISIIERVKLLQQRFPELQVFGFEFGSSICSIDDKARISSILLKEYITFPVLLSTKDFIKRENTPLCLIFKGFRGQIFYLKDVEIGTITKVIDELQTSSIGESTDVNSKGIGGKLAEFIKEPYVCHPLKNLLLNSAGSISVDEDGKRIFISDTNHHRIIIADEHGVLLDCIGCSPGFEDGAFETAKMFRPASSIYNADEDCLYFVDYENHAVRLADMESRTVRTIYPIPDTKMSGNSIWNWVKSKLGLIREDVVEAEEFDMDFTFPWHLIKMETNDLMIINHSFQNLWIMESATGKIKETYEGYDTIMEAFGEKIMDRVSLVRKVHDSLGLHEASKTNSLQEFQFATLMSSIAKLQNRILFCNADCQTVLKLGGEMDDVSHLQFSNFGVLGLPYWMVSPLERIFVSSKDKVYSRLQHKPHVQDFKVHQGRCEIRINVDISVGIKLAAPIQRGSFWCQARGAASMVPESDLTSKPTEEVGTAQQWFDELDNLAFVNPEPASELDIEEEASSEKLGEDHASHIECAVDISPGTSEVVVDAVLYLKLDKTSDSLGQNLRKVERILSISSESGNQCQGDLLMQLFQESCNDIGNIIFMRDLHVRIRLECLGDSSLDKCRDIGPENAPIGVNIQL
ncbi:uncharacterized protein LOC18447216 isoform X2 [Amborella trichopoda]|uniref:uncharacterized protein LOC18447216 isoform X2 n=1 Tax=Amborella trichopoda TaxID=13333 RepID=UPI0009BDB0CC|nr:uncharacterized protein LOC18447216 isoform X2 [Amborella trichopoda]|eukprot:XP_020531063.1 uncharacterized protein LOC18447216 isoform X2 [Amborella trichopoda]